MNTPPRASRPRHRPADGGGNSPRDRSPQSPLLPPALAGERREFDSNAGRLSYYFSAPPAVAASGSADAAAASTARESRPLLLIHSINAASSAYEVKPIYEYYARRRPVYALELPGFGFSERRERRYTPRLMCDAIAAMLGEIRRQRSAVGGAPNGAAVAPGVQPIDALALSLSCEFLARAATESPTSFATLALVSPTGFDQRSPLAGPPGSTRGMPLLYRAFTFPLWTGGVFELLTSRRSIRFFLEKTWGSKEIDEGVLDYSWLTTHQPGARFAPYDFVSGYLFSRDISRIYQSLRQPVWMVRGVRGDFVDYRAASAFAGKANWTLQTLPTGALPQFEVPGEFVRRYDAFLAASDA